MLIDTLEAVVGERPGATVPELSRDLASIGTPTADDEVSRLLYGSHGRFRSDAGSPRRWWLATTAPAPAPPGAESGQSTAESWEDISPGLYAWQTEALDAWVAQHRRGVVEAVTGTGKTRVGVAAVLEQLRRRGQALVIVPTKELQRQWLAVLGPALPAGTLVGHLGDDGRASLTSHDVVVAIVNTLRSADTRPIRPHGLLVADECHRYGALFNRLALDPRFDRRLGLSATYARDDDGHRTWLDPYFGGSCYQLGYRRAIADGVAAQVAVALAGVTFEPAEQDTYDILSDTMAQTAAKLIARHGLPREPYQEFIRVLHVLADRSGDGPGPTLARRYRAAATERRLLLAGAGRKGEAIDILAPAVAASERTIIFTQTIEASERIAHRLGEAGIETGVVHSGLPTRLRHSVLDRFAAGSLRAVSAPRVLDEGIDVPDADLALIVGASRSRRQMIQRMGRVLRPKSDGRSARFVVLYVEGTIEDPARGAHEGFLDELTGVATTIRRFSVERDADELLTFLADPAPSRPGADSTPRGSVLPAQ